MKARLPDGPTGQGWDAFRSGAINSGVGEPIPEPSRVT
jgi:hypothetical protein